ncbi:sigma-70 family RNA polymerase sigma factor [Pseudoflavitalea sp. G-6-1-2]|uniref:RNA polymerase sigma factor n=1 Tax=Pseudoflavitalea sp. G-6-1-2 TaxID=2728841 RepID=UPI00146D251C|nr:sigma-70 family RNA polymerase sigma factor [Pseudoflavitalea sp. G-6-1-2]NML23025.1 sigma-70 family RNA polymerase sigma factor [Pseudoflavitalea sp. G-6-1-2]
MTLPSSYQHDLYLRVASGNECAFRELFELYVPRLQAMITRITGSATVADDLVQEAFLKIWVARDQMTNLHNPGAWIMKIGFYQALNFQRRQKLHQQVIREVHYNHEEKLHGITGNETIDFQQLLHLVNKAVQSLPEKQKQIYRMSREQGLTISEIAAEMNLAVSTVKNLLVMALKSIRETLQQSGHLGWLIAFFHLL